ncbi:MAG: ADP-ribosylation factor family protein [Candidatus Thorarchaeota archaeon]
MSLFQRLFRSRVKQVNLTICGLDKAGKTTLINYLIYGEFQKTVPTSGMNREKIDLPKLSLDIYDLGGQLEFRDMWANYNEQSDGLIFVVDSSDKLRFEETKETFYRIINTQINPEIPVLILLHKCDLEDRIKIKDFIPEFSISDPNHKFKWAVFETSALTGEGLIDSFHWLVEFLGGE